MRVYSSIISLLLSRVKEIALLKDQDHNSKTRIQVTLNRVLNSENDASNYIICTKQPAKLWKLPLFLVVSYTVIKKFQELYNIYLV